MTTMPIELTFDQDLQTLTNLYSHQNILAIQKQEMLHAVIPSEVQEDIDAINAEFSPREENVSQQIAHFEARVKSAAEKLEETIKNDILQVVYTKPGQSVSSKAVSELANRWERTNPELAAEIRALLKPTAHKISIQFRKGG